MSNTIWHCLLRADEQPIVFLKPIFESPIVFKFLIQYQIVFLICRYNIDPVAPKAEVKYAVLQTGTVDKICNLCVVQSVGRCSQSWATGNLCFKYQLNDSPVVSFISKIQFFFSIIRLPGPLIYILIVQEQKTDFLTRLAIFRQLTNKYFKGTHAVQ